MKKLTKTLAPLLIVTILISCLIACGNNENSTVSSNKVITESVYQMEEMMSIEHTDGGITPVSFISPNYTVEYAHERLSVLRGSASSIYFSEFLAKTDKNFKDDVLYKDTVSEGGVTAEIYAKKSEYKNGVFVSLEMHQTNGENKNISPIQMYFEYDYEAKKPTRTSIIQAVASDVGYSLALAQFDYASKVAYSYNFVIEESDISALKSQLSAKTLDFAKFCEHEATSYLFAKLHTETATIEAYAFRDYGTDEISADYNTVSALYNSIYAEVSGVCVPIEGFNTSSATEKEYYMEMWSYASSKIMAIQ